MPTVRRISRDAIVDAAVEVLREGGFSAVNARSVAKKLGCSTQPIYSSFQNMDELKAALRARAIALLQRAFLLVPLPLVFFPVLYYLCAALWLWNLPAVILMLIFGAAHLTVSIQSFSAPGA